MAEYSPSEAYIDRLFQIESGGNPSDVTGSNRGLGQFSPDLEKRYGITDWRDPEQQREAVRREAREHYPILERALGRAPSEGELYLMHQQGIAGGPALLTADPDAPAWQTIQPYYRNSGIARQAITGNIPSDNPLYRTPAEGISSGTFASLWKNKFENGGGSTGARPQGVAGQSQPGINAATLGAQSSPAGVSLFGGQQPPAPDTPQQFTQPDPLTIQFMQLRQRPNYAALQRMIAGRSA